MKRPILVGAVVYDPKVALIWDIIKRYFARAGCPIDYVLYTNYELQVQALMEGQIDIAWNSPLAWVDTVFRTENRCRAIAMRDTDQDRKSLIVTHAKGPISQLSDLRDKRIGLGAWDSPQATLIPLSAIEQQTGLSRERDFSFRCFDVLVGKHGDHIGGELDAFRALSQGEVDASTMLDLNWQTWTTDGTIDPAQYRIIGTTELFDHCVFTVLDSFAADVEQQWLSVLFSMDYQNPDHREMMDLEGLKAWKQGRTDGFGPLTRAVEQQQFFVRRDAGVFSAKGGD